MFGLWDGLKRQRKSVRQLVRITALWTYAPFLNLRNYLGNRVPGYRNKRWKAPGRFRPLTGAFYHCVQELSIICKFLFTIKFYSHISFQVCYNKKLSSGQGSRLCRRVTWRGKTGFLFFLWNGKNRYAFLVDRIILL